MKYILALILSGLISLPALAAKKNICGKHKEISCSKVSKAKRSSFCWSGKMDESKKTKICRKAKKTAKMKTHPKRKQKGHGKKRTKKKS